MNKILILTIAIILGVVAIAAYGCNSNLSNDSRGTEPSPLVTVSPTPLPGNSNTDQFPTGSRCDLINVFARRVIRVQGLTVSIRIGASTELQGHLYAKVWLGERGARLLKRVTLESGVPKDVDVILPRTGTYRILVDVEVENAGRIAQCDGGFNVVVEIPRIPPPPPPPPPKPPICNLLKTLSYYQLTDEICGNCPNLERCKDDESSDSSSDSSSSEDDTSSSDSSSSDSR